MVRLSPSRARTTNRRPGLDFGDTHLMVEAARAFFIDGRSQKDVAERLKVSQATVSRLLARARDENVISFHLRPPPELGLARDLAAKLRRTCVRRVVVVPGGTGKNEGNLAGPAAGVVLEELARINENPITITASGGQTMQAVFDELIRSLGSASEWLELQRTLQFYPAVLATDHSVDPSYPATIATTLALHVNRAYGESYRDEGRGRHDGGKICINANAPSLPENFYTDSRDWDERAAYLVRYKVKATMDKALAAQLFVVGIGRANDKRYEAILRDMHPDMPARKSDAVAEICWVPITADGRVVEDLAADLVAIEPQQLRDHAVKRTSQVIAIAGGEDKLDAIHAAMIDPCFSILVTDVINARNLMRSEMIGR